MPTPDNWPTLSSRLAVHQEQLLQNLPRGNYHPLDNNGVISCQSPFGIVRVWSPETVGLTEKGNLAILDFSHSYARFVWVRPDATEKPLDRLRIRIVASVVATSLNPQGFPLMQLEDGVEESLATLNGGFKSKPFEVSPDFRIQAIRRKDFREPVQVIRFVDELRRVGHLQLTQPGGVLYSRHLRCLLPSSFRSAGTEA